MSAKTAPIPADAKNIIQNLRIADKNASLPSTSSVGRNIVVNTIETASLRMLSPNTSILRTGSIFKA